MFLFIGLIAGPGSVGASLTACSMPGMKFTRGELSGKKNGLSSVSTFLERYSLSRCDVELPRRDVKIPSLCHVATWNSHVATSF